MSLNDLGDVPAGSVLPLMWTSHDVATGANETMSALAVGDILIYKGTSMTQRASTAGFVLLDTDGIDLDTLTGVNGVSIDLGDNTDAGFYAAGSFYNVIVGPVTIDVQTVYIHLATFRIVLAETVAGEPKVDVGAWLGTAAATPSVNGVPEVDLTHVAGSTTSVSALASGVATLLADWINGGRLDLILDIIAADTTTDIPAILGALADVAADGEVTSTDTLMAYMKQLINILIGAAGIVAFPASAVPGNAVSLAEVIRQIYDEVAGVNGITPAAVADIPTAAAVADAVWDEDATAHQNAGTFGLAIGDPALSTETMYKAIVTDPAGTNIAADVIALKAETASILTDTAEIGVAGAGLTGLGGMSATMKAQVNTEVVDGLNVDTYAEPAQGTPAATLSLAAKVNYLFKAWRNRQTQTASQYSLYNDDAVTVDHKATFSDDATTADRGEVATGP